MKTFDYATIIGRDPKLWRWHVDNVLRNAGLKRDVWTFNVVIYYNQTIPQKITDEIVEICEENDIKYYLHFENPNRPFINRLYDCWNIVQELGEHPYTLRGGSDQAWFKDSFSNIFSSLNRLNDEVILQAQTIESDLTGRSRHFIRGFGTTPDTFNEEAFNKFCNKISKHELFDIHEALKEFGHPTSFSSSIKTPHNRTDGCSWLQSKELFKKHGPMPAIYGRWTGDVIIHDRYEKAGIPNLLVGNCITYHLVRGESR